jgi:hypothetical protein
MTPTCRICKGEIIGRDSRAKNCWSCYDSYGTIFGATKAINAVQKAVKKGILPPVKTLTCVDCGRPGECYDHRDYNKPLDVVPVCRKCNFRRGSAIPVKKDVASEMNVGLR